MQQRQPGGGAIAAISPTGDGITSDQQAFRRLLMTVMFKENVREIGKALDLAKRRYAAAGGAHYMIETMTLFGDPAMRLPISASQATPTPTATFTPTVTPTPTASGSVRRVYLPVVLR